MVCLGKLRRVAGAESPKKLSPNSGTLTRTAALRSMIEYLHANPVRRGLVAKAEDWEWSSARWHAGMRPAPIAIDALALEELSREGAYGAER